MFGFHLPELVIVLVVALIFFGPRKLPEIGAQIGKGIREFKKATSEFQSALEVDEKPVKHSSPMPPLLEDPTPQAKMSAKTGTFATPVVTPDEGLSHSEEKETSHKSD